jgi:hypothetical protein
MRLTIGLALAVVLVLLSITPAPVQAGFPSGCPINYGATTYSEAGQSAFPFFPTLVNSPLRRAASRRDTNEDHIVCQKFGNVPGPQFVDGNAPQGSP